MIIELITPLSIATSPMRIDVPETVYNHETQVCIVVSKADQAEYGGWSTLNGTQTFDSDGRPFDSDVD